MVKTERPKTGASEPLFCNLPIGKAAWRTTPIGTVLPSEASISSKSDPTT
jgi:hypothetical protein